MTKTDTCERCRQNFPISLLRYKRMSKGEFVYLCSECRKILDQEEAAKTT